MSHPSAPGTTMCIRRWFLLLVLLSLSESSRADELLELDWKRLSTPDFVVYSSLGRKSTERLADDLYYLRTLYNQILPPVDTDPVRPTYIFLFDDLESFWSFARQGNVHLPARDSGYYFRRPEANFMVAYLSDFHGTEGTLFHEFTHALNWMMYPSIPVWLDEGLAEVFGTFERDGDELRLGGILDPCVSVLKGPGLLSLGQFLGVDRISLNYRMNDGVQEFYSQAWLLLHRLLIENPQWQSNVAGYCRLMRAGRTRESFARELWLPMLPEIFPEQTYPPDWRPEKVYLRRDVSDLALPEHLIRDMSSLEILNNVGWFMVQLPLAPHFDTRSYFATVLKHDPDNAFAHLGMARFHHRRAELEESQACFARAKELNPGSTFILDTQGECELELYFGRLMELCLEDLGDRAHLERAEALFRSSLELEPGSHRARSGLVMSCFEDSVISTELVEMARGVSDLEPNREDLAAAYALFLARRGELERAWEAYHERFVPVSHAYMLKHKFRRMLWRTVGSDPFQESETAAP